MPKFFYESSEDSLVKKHYSNLIGYWTLNNTLRSFYGTPLLNTLTGTYGYVAGLNGRKCLELNGSSRYIYRSSTSVGDIDISNFSFSVWAYFDTLSVNSFLIYKSEGDVLQPNNIHFAIYIGGTDWYVSLSDGAGHSIAAHAAHGLSTGTWYNLTFTVDRSSVASYYRNGAYVNNALSAGTGGTAGYDITSSTNLTFGRGVYNGTTYYMDGKMQDIWFRYGYLFTPSDVKQIYMNMR